MIRRRGLILAMAATVMILTAACANTDADFQFGWTYETDRIVHVSGEANKHIGGEQSMFNVEFNNLDSVAWQEPYCIVLVDEERLVSVFYEGEIDLAAGEESSVIATGIFPEDKVGKRYGIRFVIPGEVIAEPSSVWSGNNDLHLRADWFEVSDCSSLQFGWTFETDRVVNVSGEANKHVGGEQSTFNVELNNLDSIAWQTPYCIVLVDEDRLVSVFYEDEIDLAPGETSSVSATGIFPEDKVGKRYGIRFVIPGEVIADPSSVWSGNNDLHRSADWFEVSDCSS
ncbi:MAG: hypothetical protein HOL45_08540, partial [Chloroflexi bacterium]|nr:hypothetical protein [Chloroflexota bacterium]